jgi:hypothetical protein
MRIRTDSLFLSEDPKVPPVSARLSIVKLFLELSLYAPALLVLQGIMAADDQDVEAWYLEGWCFYIMTEQAQENGGMLDELTWEELAKDSRDCLETCRVVRASLLLFLIRESYLDPVAYNARSS